MTQTPCRILVVDDERYIRMSFRRFLEELNYEVLEAENGKQGIEVFRKSKPDLLLVDLWMPEVGGIELLNIVKAESPNTPMIVVSGAGAVSEVIEAVRSGAWDYIEKPVTDLEIFHYTIQKALERARLIQENLDGKRRLEERKAELELLLNNIETQIWYLTDEFSYGAVNQAHADFVGIARSELEHGHIESLQKIHDFDTFTGNCKEVFLSGKQTYGDEWVKNSKGESRILAITRTPHINEEGTVDFVVCSALDVTEQRQAEKAMIQAKEVAEEAANAKARWFSSLSHEIRLPMNGVLGMAELLLNSELTTEQKDYTKIIGTSSKALLSLLNDMLDYSKADAGKIELEKIDFSLDEIIENLLDLLAPTAAKKGVELVGRFTKDVPLLLKGDPGRLRQIIMNITGNAIKFTSEGQVVLRVERVREQKNEVELRFTISDTGIGIPSEKQEQIFEAFSQATSATTRKYGGTGLGLPIAKHLVSMMGGEIHVESVVDEGSVFSISLMFEKQKMVSSHQYTIPETQKGQSALVVESNLEVREYLCELLTEWHCVVDGEYDGERAVNTIQKAFEAGHPYDVILVSSTLPDMACDLIGRSVHDLYGERQVNLILLTYISDLANRNKTDSVYLRFLKKPIRKNRLFECLTRTTIDPEKNDSDNKKKSVLAEMNPKVLVVEDDFVSRILLVEILSNAGVRVDAVNNGTEAVTYLEATPCSLVIMDCRMPDMSGYEVTRQLRDSVSINKNVPVIAVTGEILSEVHEKGRAAGMNEMMSKPVESDRIIKAVEKYCLLPESQE